jgi:hypothetical protein
MAWQEAKPSPSDIPNLDLASLITSNKLALRQGLEKHSFWTDASTNSIGIPRLSDGSFGPGACRAYFAPDSSMSTADAASKALAGRLFITSDTSRLFGFVDSSSTPVLLGSTRAITYATGSQATIPSNTRVLMQLGTASIVATSSGTSIAAVTFPTAYDAAPRVTITPFGVSAFTVNLAFHALTSITASGFSVALRSLGATPYATSVVWRSHGTVSI